MILAKTCHINYQYNLAKKCEKVMKLYTYLVNGTFIKRTKVNSFHNLNLKGHNVGSWNQTDSQVKDL